RIADAEVDASFRALQGRRAAEGWSGGLVDLKEVWFSEQAKLRTDISERDYRRAAMNDEHLAEYHRVGVRSVVAVPIRARGHLVGVMAFLQTRQSGRSFDDDDLLFIQQLVDRAALAWDNARLYEARNEALSSLQTALLPPALPVLEGIELASRYEVADDALDVGGDFYDVIEISGDRHELVIGDVRSEEHTSELQSRV